MPHITPAQSPETPSGASRRKVLAAVAWSTPVIAFATAAPAMAASPPDQVFGISFDGGAGGNGAFNTTYVILYSARGGTVTLTAPLRITVDIVGLNPAAQDERSSSDTLTTAFGSVTRLPYDPATRTTRLLWDVRVGTAVTAAKQGSDAVSLYIRFLDGSSATPDAGRITNKIVVTGITGGSITQPNKLPVDSSVIGDVRNTISPDGIY